MAEQEIRERLSKLTPQQLETRFEELKTKRGLTKPTITDPNKPKVGSSPEPVDLGQEALEWEILKEMLGYNPSS